MRSARQFLGAVVLTLGVGAGLAAGPVPQASAAPTVSTFQVPLVVNTGIWACSGIHTFCSYTPVAITGETPGTVIFRAVPFGEKIPPNLSSWWNIRIHWRNVGTGASGVLDISSDGSASVFTGAGLVTASTTARDQVIAGTGVFFVP
ncbi:hypothetical protein C8K36_105310 [Rhodococcus sp. OK519]|uniref:hypothetical protein n=1 Tax=Rhodococcus sp. OK519 TaxID=2135729 RepID=UPI000D358022|nr:hypothetical protein C8K36_105310 [Rhodococcus sp. OK519]